MTTYFFDRSMGRKIPQALKLLNIDVEAHDDHFPWTTPDDLWLSVVGRHGWVVVTKDDRIRYNAILLDALVSAGVGCFTLLQASATRWQLVQTLARAWDDIERISASGSRPFLYGVRTDGSLLRRVLP